MSPLALRAQDARPRPSRRCRRALRTQRRRRLPSTATLAPTRRTRPRRPRRTPRCRIGPATPRRRTRRRTSQAARRPLVARSPLSLESRTSTSTSRGSSSHSARRRTRPSRGGRATPLRATPATKSPQRWVSADSASRAPVRPQSRHRCQLCPTPTTTARPTATGLSSTGITRAALRALKRVSSQGTTRAALPRVCPGVGAGTGLAGKVAARVARCLPQEHRQRPTSRNEGGTRRCAVVFFSQSEAISLGRCFALSFHALFILRFNLR